MNLDIKDDLFENEEKQNTPLRWKSFQEELKKNREYSKFTIFKNDGYTGMSIQRVEFTSFCSHHTLPFFGVVYLGYIANKNIITGLSKLARVVDKFASKPQLQERLTKEIKDFLNQLLKPKGIMVVIKARHLCMECRGVKKSNSWTVTSEIDGAFKNLDARMEFFELVKLKFLEE